MNPTPAQPPIERIGPELCLGEFAIARICDGHPRTEAVFDELAHRYNTQPDLLAVLLLIRKGIATNAIKSKPMLIGLDDPEAEETDMKSLDEIVGAAIARASREEGR